MVLVLTFVAVPFPTEISIPRKLSAAEAVIVIVPVPEALLLPKLFPELALLNYLL